MNFPELAWKNWHKAGGYQPIRMIFCGLMGIFLVGCGFLSRVAGGGTPTPVAKGEILFEDDFTHVPSGWGIGDSSDAVVSYEEGGLRLLVREAGKNIWSVAGQRLADVRMEVSIKQVAGPEDNLMGVVCRYRNRENFYMMFVSRDGYYGIGKVADSIYTLLGAEQLQYNPMLHRSDLPLRLVAECSGRRLSLSAGDKLLMAVEDDTFDRGDVGVIAGAYREGGVDVLFDDFRVRQP